MKKQDFESQLRQQMEGFEVAPPDGLWEAIEQQTGAGNKKAATRRMTGRWWAVAASLLLLVGGAGLLWYHQEELPQGGDEPRIAESAKGESHARAHESLYNNKDAQFAYRHERTAEKQIRHNEGAEESLMGDIAAVQNPETADAPNNELAETSPENTSRSPLLAPRSSITTPRSPLPAPRSSITTPRSSMQYIAHVDGMLANDIMYRDPVRMSNAMLANFNSAYEHSNTSTRMEDVVNLTGYEEITHYAQPVKFGVAVATSLYDRWGVQTGLNYMRQQTMSTQITPHSTFHDKQTYHYVGVPVQLTYHLLGTSWGAVYGVAGGEADFNVKTSGDMDGIDYTPHKDRPQLSAMIGAGFQLMPLPQIALYAEPGATYYFDNGSTANTRMKDQKLNFSLQFGVKYIFK